MERTLLKRAVARAVAAQVMGMIGECFREDEHRDLHAAIYELVVEGVDRYERQARRLAAMSEPQPN